MKYASTLLVLALAAGSARAGIYSTTDRDDDEIRKYSPNVLNFFSNLKIVRTIGADKVDFDNPLRKRYMLYEALGGPNPQGLTLEQKLDYSAALIRRRKFQQAIDFLTPITRQHPELFLFDSHLAMAYWGTGQQGNDRRAVEILSQVLSKNGWPEDFHDLTPEQRSFIDLMGWNEAHFGLYRKAETYLLKLMKLRLAEPPGASFKTVDALFGDAKEPIKFVNVDGVFEPGRIAAAELKKLPQNALEIVEQLNLWLPDDARLYWLLGELANAHWTPDQLKDASAHDLAKDNLKAANKIFDELVYDRGVEAAELRNHRRILQEYAKTVVDVPPTFGDLEKKIDIAIGKDDKGGVPMNTRTMAITFAAGMAVGIFAIWQFQEIRRRRRGG